MMAGRADEGDTSAGSPSGLSLIAWAERALHPMRPARHHRLLLAALDDVASGACDRLMVLMPPGSAKSTYCSIVLPPWWLARHPGASVIAASHTESLAHRFGRRSRALVAEHGDGLGQRLAREDRSAGRWSLDNGGEYFATGVRGPIIGRRADLVLIDDPVKNATEAESALARDALWAWFQSDLVTRLKPAGRIVLVMTRWHEDDLAGRLLSGDDCWRVLRLPALAEAGDALGRAEGEALWPEWEDAAALARKRRSVGERMWASLFQQRPRPDEGGLFRVDRVAVLDREPAVEVAVRAWDLAATEAAPGRDPDWTTGLKLARLPSGGFCVLDVVRMQGAPLAVEQAIAATAMRDGAGVSIGLPQDPGQAGKQQVSYLTGRLAGHRVSASRETGSKLVRAGPVSAQFEAGLVSMLRAPWNAEFVAELREFPHGRKDDQVDALSRAFAMLTQVPAPARRVRLDVMAR